MRRALIAVNVVAALLAACGGDADGHLGASASDPPGVTASGSATSGAGSIETLEGDFDVGGYSLHMRCRGSGSPTIVYLHGLSHAPGDASGSSSRSLPLLLSERGYRFCAYDRANTGFSDDVPGPLTAVTSAADLHRLLDVAEVEPPYVLLGASFGGLIADVYAATFPDEVVGMVQLDAGIPDEIDVDHLFPPDERFRHEKHGLFGWADVEEQIDEFAAYEDAHALIGQEPRIPTIYLLAMPSGWTGPPGYASAIRHLMDDFVDRYGEDNEVQEVVSPHAMEAAVPEVIADAVEAVVFAADRARAR
jgi:pimeloyl-ACP methyl ester carboxylesterase